MPPMKNPTRNLRKSSQLKVGAMAERRPK